MRFRSSAGPSVSARPVRSRTPPPYRRSPSCRRRLQLRSAWRRPGSGWGWATKRSRSTLRPLSRPTPPRYRPPCKKSSTRRRRPRGSRARWHPTTPIYCRSKMSCSPCRHSCWRRCPPPCRRWMRRRRRRWCGPWSAAAVPGWAEPPKTVSTPPPIGAFPVCSSAPGSCPRRCMLPMRSMRCLPVRPGPARGDHRVLEPAIRCHSSGGRRCRRSARRSWRSSSKHRPWAPEVRWSASAIRFRSNSS